MTLTRLYKDLGREKSKECIVCYKEILRLCPLCLEAIIALKEFGEDYESILSLSLNKQQQQQMNNNTNTAINNKLIIPNLPSSIQNVDSSWIPILSQTILEMKRNQPQKSLFLLKKLESKFINNLFILEKMAITYQYHDEPSIINTVNTFQKIRLLDPYYIGSMDIYCSLLKRRSLQFEMNKICHDLVTTNPHSPETWTSLALYYFFKENVEKAVENVDRAIGIRDTHTAAHSLRGEIFLSLDEPKEALPSLEKAFHLSKNILTARELVRCHLFLNQMKEALNVAKTIHSLSPDYSKSMALMGMVLANQPEERTEARRILTEALALAPNCIDTVMTLSKLNVVEGKIQEAIDMLLKQLEYQETDLMHTEIAGVYTLKEMYSEAMAHYNSALEINSQYEPASRGLARLELIMKGIDPDQSLEETEEQEVGGDIDDDEDDEYVS
eukprot:gene2584-3201_t